MSQNRSTSRNRNPAAGPESAVRHRTPRTSGFATLAQYGQSGALRETGGRAPGWEPGLQTQVVSRMRSRLGRTVVAEGTAALAEVEGRSDPAQGQLFTAALGAAVPRAAGLRSYGSGRAQACLRGLPGSVRYALRRARRERSACHAKPVRSTPQFCSPYPELCAQAGRGGGAGFGPAGFPGLIAAFTGYTQAGAAARPLMEGASCPGPRDR